MNEHDIRFMEHALALARKGVGLASPNPTVGCVIVRDGEIAGEGFHQYDARDHAEILALKSAGEKSRGATLYVTLEPCNHTGRTGPCTEAIIAGKVRRVVVAMEDPNPKTAGAGFDRLRAAAIEVESGILEPEAQPLNEGFAKWIRTGKPFVTLKSALTLDGQLALPDSSGPLVRSKKRRKRKAWITSEESRAEVQRMRHASDALLTGIGTIHVDDPLLTDRSGLPRRRRLLRIVVDSGLALRPTSRIAQSAADADLLVLAGTNTETRRVRALRKMGAEVMHIPSRGGHVNLDAVMSELARREILSVLLEAGPTLNGAVLQAGIVDKLALFYAPKIAGDTRVPFAVAPKLQLPPLHSQTMRQIGPDFLLEGYLTDVYRNHRT